MDNPYVAIGSVLAVGLLILLNYWIGGWRKARLASTHEARARYHEDFWHDKLEDVLLSKDGRTALIALTDESAVGLVHAMGDRFITRRLGPDSFKTVGLENGHTLILRLRDFSLPQVHIIYSDVTDITAWHDRLSRLLNKQETA